MPPKTNTGRKYTVLRDEMGITGGGIYAVLPFENIDKYGKAVFKIGLSSKFHGRMEGYMTMTPRGLYYVAFLENPRYRYDTRLKGIHTPSDHYKKIESELIQLLIDKGAERVSSTARVRGLNDKNEGETELFYTNSKTIHEAFLILHHKYGGTYHDYHDTSRVNSNRVKIEKQNPDTYIGKVVIPVHFV